MRGFAGKTVVITGGAGGLGRAFARAFARAGARPALLDLDGGAAAAAAAQVGGLGLACDVTDPAACRRAVETVAAELGGVDALINNAGITHRSAFAQTSAEVYRRVMEVNFFGALHCTQAALPWLLESRGIVVAISSIAGFSPLLGRTGYAASKHALHGLFDSLRAELKPRGVHVLIVCPGFTDTGIAGAALDGDGSLTTHRQSTVGRVASPAEVAAATLRAARRQRRLLVLSTVGRLTRLFTRLAPGLYERLMARSLAGELRR